LELVAPKISHHRSEIQAHGACKRGLLSVDKFLWIKATEAARLHPPVPRWSYLAAWTVVEVVAVLKSNTVRILL
jgi:hypothetical protein